MMLTRRAILGLAASAPLGAASLPEQSAGMALDRAFPDPRVSYLLMDCARSREICSRWAHPMDAVPVGSLVKPFTALAYGESHRFRFPAFNCAGAAGHCWLPEGHGRMEINTAIAHSCNAYFLELARDVTREALEAVIQRFGLSAPDPGVETAVLIGLGRGWRISPFAIARAYSELIARWFDPGVRDMLAGMALSGQIGTGRGVGRGAYVKTGTAPCIHESKGGGDGYVIALYPTDAPRFNLLVRVHGVPGARAAWVCGKMRRYV
ncbi:MAG TPA: penicillin-binding transpeptidase domain-containing protein [Bryobacteraceae bacterium]|jgi:cell division protein FtsI/penicillin-binding protein 2|nr:penicillin-binding transpeptidase domain-containing protein [Bryobacteraceae bacterium]